MQLDLFDITGRNVKRLIDKRLDEGTHQISWLCEDSRGNSLPGGVYFYQLKHKDYNQKGKFIIVK